MSKKKNYNDGTTMNTRAYSWDLVIYEIDKQYLHDRLSYLVDVGVVTHYSYIIHDHDTELKDDVMIDKPLHAHALIVFNQKVSVKVIIERLLLYTEHNTFGQPIRDKRGCYRYLTHKDDPDKYQYDESCIVDFDDYFSKYDISTDLSLNREYQEINQMIDDFIVMSYRQLACKYGKDFIKNYRSYEYYFTLIYEQEFNLTITHDDNISFKDLLKTIKK